MPKREQIHAKPRTHNPVQFKAASLTVLRGSESILMLSEKLKDGISPVIRLVIRFYRVQHNQWPLSLTSRSFLVLHMVHFFQHLNPGRFQMLTVEARPKTKAFQAPAFWWFTLNKTQLLLFNQIRISICSSDCPHPLLANKECFPIPILCFHI